MAAIDPPRKDAAAVFLEKGEFIIHELTVHGAKVKFELTDTTDKNLPITLMNDKSTPAETSPNVVYRRKWPEAGDTISRDRDHVMGIFHLKGDKYTYKVTHHHVANDEVIIDIDYTGKKDGEVDRKLLNVLLSKKFSQ